jgi:riboflavin biosynthesis pyrimidine reductase
MLELLYETDGLPRFDLPSELAAAYPGSLGFERPRLVTNFVQTIDGVVAIPDVAGSNALVADDSEADRFVVGLLRACAHAVVIGSGVLEASEKGLWKAESVYPAAADAFAELRRRLGLPPAPERVVVTGSGELPESHRVFSDGALVVTTETGAARLEGRLPPEAEVVAVEGSRLVDVAALVTLLRSRGHELILSEAGPHLFGSLLEAALVDELFVTVSPLLAGRGEGERYALVEAFEALPGRRLDARVLGVRRARDHLFLRYAL